MSCAVTTSGTFAGMSQPQLADALSKAQTALLDLVTGNKPVTLSYAQGEGNRSVTYGRTNEAQLRSLIRELQSALGIGSGRRPLRVSFG